MFYKFYCKECEKEIELNLKVAELPNAKCCECGSSDIDRVWDGLSQIWNVPGSYSSSRKDG